jgi:porin
LANRGVTFIISLTGDGSKDLLGGLNTQSTAWRQLFDAAVQIDSKLIGLNGGTFYADFQNESGRNGSDLLTGDLQKFDNIDADGRTQLSELWYQQVLFEGAVRIKAGKADANTDFDVIDNGGDFINSSAQNSPTIFPLPSYPDTATCVSLFLTSKNGWWGSAGVFDGSLARGVETGSFGPRLFFQDPDDLFYIGEAGKRWGTAANELPGKISVGGWYDTNHFLQFNGHLRDGTGGLYAELDQTLWKPANAGSDDPRNLGMFLTIGNADRRVSTIDQFGGGGLAWMGPLPHRENDVFGIGVDAAHISSEAGLPKDHEIATELFYRIQMTSTFAVQPDLQYIAAPGGKDTPDAVVATLRLQAQF